MHFWRKRTPKVSGALEERCSRATLRYRIPRQKLNPFKDIRPRGKIRYWFLAASLGAGHGFLLGEGQNKIMYWSGLVRSESPAGRFPDPEISRFHKKPVQNGVFWPIRRGPGQAEPGPPAAKKIQSCPRPVRSDSPTGRFSGPQNIQNP